MKKLFLLDAYALIYRAYYGFISKPLVNSKGMNTGAVYGFVKTLQDVLQGEKPDLLAVCFDPVGGTFRHKQFPTYKAQREAQPEDITLAVPYIKQIIEAYNIPIVEVDNYEADDVIGTLARLADEAGCYDTYMMTPDKDYAQLVTDRSRMFRPRSMGPGYDILGEQEVLEKYGLKRTSQVIDMLGLQGDAADNIPGCPGVGPKTAQKLIAEFDSIENLLANTDQLKGAMQKKVVENAQQIRDSKYLATICREVPGVAIDEASFAVKAPNVEALAALFEELEFRQLRVQLLQGAGISVVASPAPSAPKPAVRKKSIDDGMGDLFASSSDDADSASSSDNGSQMSSADGVSDEASLATVDEPSVTILPGIESIVTHYTLCDTPEKRQDLVSQLLFADQWAFDTETTSIDVMQAELVGISFAIDGHEAWYVPVPSDREEAVRIVEELRPLFTHPSAVKIAQNVKYDYSVLKRYGMEVQAPVFDTMIAHYLLQPEMQHGMDYLSEVYLKYRPIPTSALLGDDAKKEAKKGNLTRTMRDLPVAQVMEYCCEDSDVTFQLAQLFRRDLQEESAAQRRENPSALTLERLFYDVEMPLVKVLADMELTGVRLDVSALKESETILNAELLRLEGRLAELAGHPFNPLSPKAVGAVLFEELNLDPKAKKTRTGQYTTSEEVLQQLKTKLQGEVMRVTTSGGEEEVQKAEIIEDILSYRGIKKLLSTYIESLPDEINAATGRIHTSFNQTVTSTGRLSSSNPNLQNIPIRDDLGRELRKAFVPDEGEVFFSADYSQIELRLMAHLSQDPNMLEAFLSGEDIHAATAAKIYHLSVGEVSKLQRTKAKTANFGIIYGISVFGLASRLNIPRGEAKELIDGYFRTYPKIQEYMNRSIEVAREKGYVETLFGRKRMLPDIHSANSTVRGYAERNAINAPIQGTAADIIKIAMVRIARRIRKEKLHAKLLIQVHDELNFSVPVGELDRLRTLVLEEMAGACSLSVPLIADCGEGKNWLEAH